MIPIDVFRTKHLSVKSWQPPCRNYITNEISTTMQKLNNLTNQFSGSDVTGGWELRLESFLHINCNHDFKALVKRTRKSTQVNGSFRFAFNLLLDSPPTCADFGRAQVCTQVDARFSPFGHPTRSSQMREI